MTIPSDFVTGKLLQQSLLKIVNAFDTKIVDSHTFQDKAINLPAQRGKSNSISVEAGGECQCKKLARN